MNTFEDVYFDQDSLKNELLSQVFSLPSYDVEAVKKILNGEAEQFKENISRQNHEISCIKIKDLGSLTAKDSADSG